MPSEPSERERCAFELGIKLGALFHQFTGTPVSLNSKASLEKAMEEAVKNQPYVVEAEVKIDRERLSSLCEASEFGYASLEGRMLSARVKVCYASSCFTGYLKYSPETGYCMMSLGEI